MSRVRLLTILACLVVLLGAQPALACAVCYGDPNSAMTHGAQAGVLVLLGVIGAVLTGFASLLIFWMRRASNLDVHAKAIEEATSVRTATPF
jgi:hypothetical protein